MAEDEASVTDGVPALVAEMANFSAGGPSAKKALLRISQAFCDLAECLLTRLEELRGFAADFEAETDTAGSAELPETSVSIEVPRPELLRAVAGTLQQLVGALVSEIKDNAEIQTLMPAIQKVSATAHRLFLQELMNIGESQQPSPGNVIPPPREETLVGILIEDTGTASRARAGDGLGAGDGSVAGGTSVEHHCGTALLRISQAVYSLAETLLTSLEEFRKAEQTLELASGHSPVSGDEARPELLHGVVGALKEMVEALVSAIKGNRDVQRLMPAIQKAVWQTIRHSSKTG